MIRALTAFVLAVMLFFTGYAISDSTRLPLEIRAIQSNTAIAALSDTISTLEEFRVAERVRLLRYIRILIRELERAGVRVPPPPPRLVFAPDAPFRNRERPVPHRPTPPKPPESTPAGSAPNNQPPPPAAEPSPDDHPGKSGEHRKNGEQGKPDRDREESDEDT